MRHLRFLTAATFLLPALLFAQAQGRVRGTVTDSAGSPIANATVIITCPDVATYRKEVTSDDKGIFTMLIVDATKRYLFHVEAPGYQAIEQLHKPLIGAQTLEIAFPLKSIQQVQKEAEEQALSQPGIKELREGKELLDAKDISGARAKFAAAASLKPDLYLAWYELARLDLDSGKADDALANAEKCLQISANFAQCLGLAANACKAKGDMAGFEKYMAAYKLANPMDPVIFFNEAATFLNKNDDAAAKPLLEQALAVDDAFPPALFELGMVYLRAGDSAKAKELLQKFLSVAPDHKDAAMARDMLKYL